MKRLFDILFAFLALLVLLPFLVIIGIAVGVSSPGGVFFKQKRVGRNGKPFELLKFRSMRPNSEAAGQLTLGKDDRITGIGHFIRKFKIDELPQLINVLRGEMSIVGPRPEVPKYVALYTETQKNVLSVRPGLTDNASLEYFEEDRLLGEADDPEQVYVSEIMPAKLELNLYYVRNRSFGKDLAIILKTVLRILRLA